MFTEAARAETVTLIAEGDPVRVLVPSDGSLESTWYTTSYTPDSSWLSGTTGVGYDTGTGYGAFINTDISSQINGVNCSFYMRQSFSLLSTSGVTSLTLRMKYDDGFVVYLNGILVKAVNAPSPVVWDSNATTGHEASLFNELAVSTKTGPHNMLV